MPPPLASLEQFSNRLGASPEGADVDRAEAALDDASALIRTEAGEDWLDAGGALETVPAAVEAVALAVALRAYRNPEGVQQSQVGDVSVTYAAGGGSAFLYPQERRIVRRAAGRQAVGSIQLTAPAPEMTPTAWEV